jgi:hypothetical protein
MLIVQNFFSKQKDGSWRFLFNRNLARWLDGCVTNKWPVEVISEADVLKKRCDFLARVLYFGKAIEEELCSI